MEREFKACIDYINEYWKELTCFNPKDKGIHIGLPYRYVTPSDGRFSKDQFYWDSYFIILGLVASGEIELAKGMVDNFIYLYKRFNIIPSRNRFYNLGISQPPFLTSMILEIFEVTEDKNWLKKTVSVAEKELKNYWMNDKDERDGIEIHLVYKGLSRYCDHYVNHITAEHESGWDMTSRFYNQCLDYLPVDLNCCLYKYECDLAQIYEILGNNKKSKLFLNQAEKRKNNINELMWNCEEGFYFDYNYILKKQSDFYSLAGYYPLWTKIASREQALIMRDKLSVFEYDGGLANTWDKNLSEEFKQWDYPNGWANQHWIVIKGLLNYGFEEDAKRIADKWLKLNAKVFKETNKFWERYDVVKCTPGRSERYPIQTGFGWTNAIFVKLISEFYNNLLIDRI